MDNVWNYKQPLIDSAAFEKFEQQYNVRIPEELKTFVVEHNEASPEKDAFDSESGEHLFSDVLRFDSGETRKVTAYDAMEEIQNKELIPFAKDPFGNYICLSLKDGTVRLWDHEDHETGTTAMAGRNLQDFIENLHE